MYELATTIMQDRLREAERHRLGRVARPAHPLRTGLARRLVRWARALAPELPEASAPRGGPVAGHHALGVGR